MRSLSKRSGFTLIETLIYSVLISAIIGGALYSAYGLIEGSEKLNDKVAIEEEANFLMKKIEWMLSSVDAIGTPAAGTIASTLIVTRTNFGTNNPLTFDFDAPNVSLKRGVNGTVTTLNSERTPITNLIFEHIAPIGTKPRAIKTMLEISGKTYQTTLYMRK